MAPKKRSYIDNPPSASPSDDDDENWYVQQPVDEEDSSHQQEDDDSSSEEEEEVQHSRNPPPSTSISNPKPVASSQSQPKPTVTPNSKPIKAKPQAQTQTQTTTGSRSGKKRVADDNNANENTSKRKKKKETISTAAAAGGGSDNEENNDCMEEEGVRLTGKKSKKKINGRVFNEDDELAILKGIADFLSQTGKDPMMHSADFHDFMKNNKAFLSEASTGQIKRKVRGLKEKFNKPSQSLTKTHDKKCFELFQKIIWRSNGVSEAEEQNGKVVTNKVQKKNVSVDHIGSSNVVTEKVQKKNVAVDHIGSSKVVTEKVQKKDVIGSSKVVTDKVQKKDVAVEHIASSSKTAVDNSYIVNEILRFSSDDTDLCASSAKNGLELIDESKRAEMEGDWKKFHIAVMEIFVKRAQIAKDAVSLILKELNKSMH